jgi:hypothetical protein
MAQLSAPPNLILTLLALPQAAVTPHGLSALHGLFPEDGAVSM